MEGNGVHQAARVDTCVVDQCVRDSGGLEKDQTNAFLESEIESASRRGVVIIPTAFVNTAALRGSLSLNNVFTAICAGYLAGTESSVCNSCMSCLNKESCINSGGRCSDPLNLKLSYSVREGRRFGKCLATRKEIRLKRLLCRRPSII